jgi:hypothetical protein
MSLGAISQQFLREVETATGMPVHVEADERLQPPLLARVQLARRGAPLHRVAYHPNARAMADYLIASQCAFVLRLHALPAAERLELTDAPVADRDALELARVLTTHADEPHADLVARLLVEARPRTPHALERATVRSKEPAFAAPLARLRDHAQVSAPRD